MATKSEHRSSTTSDTPMTDEVLRIEYNYGSYPGNPDDGVTPAEAHAVMVSSLAALARKLERQVTRLKLAAIRTETTSEPQGYDSGNGAGTI